MSLCSFRSLSTWSIQLQMGMFSSLLQWSNSFSNQFFPLHLCLWKILFFSLSRLNSDELYAISLQEISSSRSEDTMLFGMCCLFICSLFNIFLWLVLSLLRLLTEVHIRTHEVDYEPAFEQTQALLVSVSGCYTIISEFMLDSFQVVDCFPFMLL